jgi:polyferredoxin
MGFLTFRLVAAGHSFLAVGAVFVMMCVITTLIAIALGIVYKERAWCMICPMGKLQEQVGKIRKNATKETDHGQ